jgi:hypothetical protein
MLIKSLQVTVSLSQKEDPKDHQSPHKEKTILNINLSTKKGGHDCFDAPSWSAAFFKITIYDFVSSIEIEAYGANKQTLRTMPFSSSSNSYYIT